MENELGAMTAQRKEAERARLWAERAERSQVKLAHRRPSGTSSTSSEGGGVPVAAEQHAALGA